MDEISKGPCLGLIGGLGVGATIHNYQELVKEHTVRRCVPNLLIIHADVNRVLKDATTIGRVSHNSSTDCPRQVRRSRQCLP
jgi:hypothetical protein